MIETEEQRRWWFATHPEYSWSRKKSRSTRQVQAKENTAKGEAENIGEHLSRYFRERQPDGGAFMPRLPRLPSYEEFSRWPKEVMLKFLRSLNTLLQNNPLLIDPDHFTSPRALSKELLERMAQPGPGKWVLIPRGPLGMEHQSKMSGFPIIEKDGKYYVYEYEVPNPSGGEPVLFDDYRKGIYYEYKGRLGNLVNRKTQEFDPWCKELVRARKQAASQVKAAEGRRVIWRVGAEQVKAYRQAIGKMPGLRIEP